jgi:hypothetical protein
MVSTFWMLSWVIGALFCAACMVCASAAPITEEAGLVPSPTAIEAVAAPTEQGDAAPSSERFWSTFANSHPVSFREASGAPFWLPAAIIFGHNSALYDLEFDDPAPDLAEASGLAHAPGSPTKSPRRPQPGAGPDRSPNWAKDLAAQLGITIRRTGSQYSAISLDGDVAEIGLGVKAIRSIHSYSEISLADDAAMTGLKSSDQYNPISLNGDASEIGFLENTQENTGSKTGAVFAPQFDDNLLGYVATLVYFIASRQSLPYFFVILIGYVAFAGIQTLIARLR